MLRRAHWQPTDRSSIPWRADLSSTKAGQQNDLVHSSRSSTAAPIDDAEDDTCDDIPVFDAQRFNAGSSVHRDGAGPQVVRPSYHLKHDRGHDAMHKHVTGSRMAQHSTSPSEDCCTPEPFAKSLVKDGHPKQHADFNSRDYFLDQETERWDLRQKNSGAVGRLVVYHAGQSPNEDIFLRGGGRHHIVLAGLRDGGQAARAGVKVWDRLASIDGKKDILRLEAEAVQERLEAPVVLVFLGFVGKLEAEVRLQSKHQVCGISSQQEAVWGTDSAPLQVCEEHIFNIGKAPLHLAVMPSRQSTRQMQQSDEEGKGEKEDGESREEVKDTDEEEGGEEEGWPVSEENDGCMGCHLTRRQKQRPAMRAMQKKVTWRRTPGHSTSWTKHVLEVAPCFELQQSEAHILVKRAMEGAQMRSLMSHRSVEDTTFRVVV